MNMFLDQRLRKAVSFLVADIGGQRTEVGTVFFLAKSLYDNDERGVDNTFPGVFTIYAVTARHVITNFERQSIYIRMNTTDGNFVDIPTLASDWTRHPETDVAVYDLFPLRTHVSIPGLGGRENVPIADIGALAFPMLATSEYLNEYLVGEGHEVFLLGLFVGHSGKQRALPIVRFGNIALFPWEPVEVYLSDDDKINNKATSIAAHLIECRSMGGLSGAPVMFYDPPLGVNLEPSARAEAFATRFQRPVILGLVHGQYDEEETRIQRVINAGISIVIPSQKIREAILQQKLQDERSNRASGL